MDQPADRDEGNKAFHDAIENIIPALAAVHEARRALNELDKISDDIEQHLAMVVDGLRTTLDRLTRVGSYLESPQPAADAEVPGDDWPLRVQMALNAIANHLRCVNAPLSSGHDVRYVQNAVVAAASAFETRPANSNKAPTPRPNPEPPTVHGLVYEAEQNIKQAYELARANKLTFVDEQRSLVELVANLGND